MSPLLFAVILYFHLLTPLLHQQPPFIHIGVGATSLILVTDRLASLGLVDTSNHLVYAACLTALYAHADVSGKL